MATNKTLTVQATKEIRDYCIAKCDNENADLEAAGQVIARLHAEREEVVELCRELKVFWTEGLAAVSRVLERNYGYNTTKQETHPFTGKPIPPKFLSIQTGVGEQVNVTAGRFLIPGTSIVVTPQWVSQMGIDFDLFGQMKRKDEATFQSFCDAVVEEVRANSIYRGKMLEVRFMDDGDGNDIIQPPLIIQPPALNAGDLILPKLTAGYINTELFKFVQHLETNRRHNLSMNRKILLAGTYGTGKTLTAGVTAKMAIQHGWTVLWFKPSAQLNNPFDCMRKALEVAQLYGPCMLFQEDLDEFLGRERSAAVNEVVNTLDNIMNKSSEFLFVATTNHPEKLDPVTLRRFDLLVSFELPDAEAVRKLVALYGGSLLPKDADLTKVGLLLAGKAPSIIQSAVESARRASIYRAVETSTEPVLDPEDIVSAAEGRTQHVALIERPPRVDRDSIEQVADSIKVLGAMVSGQANGHLLPATSVRFSE